MRSRLLAGVLCWLGCGHGSQSVDATAIDTPPALGPVQCRTSDECVPLTGAGCFAARPGGVCVNCGDPGDSCPQGTDCVMGGTSGSTECAQRCASDADCNLGMSCVLTGTLAGHCQPRACGPNLPPCPSPYTFCRPTTASLSECSRPMCADGCVAPLVCPTGGAFCVEP